MTKTTKITSQIALFTVLMTWPLLPFIAKTVFWGNVEIATINGARALGLI